MGFAAASVSGQVVLVVAPQPVALAEGSWIQPLSEGADAWLVVGARTPLGVRPTTEGYRPAVVGFGRPPAAGRRGEGVWCAGRVIRSGRAGAGVYEDVARGDKSLLGPSGDGAGGREAVAPRRPSVVGGAGVHHPGGCRVGGGGAAPVGSGCRRCRMIRYRGARSHGVQAGVPPLGPRPLWLLAARRRVRVRRS